jgi:hypothetical protein
MRELASQVASYRTTMLEVWATACGSYASTSLITRCALPTGRRRALLLTTFCKTREGAQRADVARARAAMKDCMLGGHEHEVYREYEPWQARAMENKEK